VKFVDFAELPKKFELMEEFALTGEKRIELVGKRFLPLSQPPLGSVHTPVLSTGEATP